MRALAADIQANTDGGEEIRRSVDSVAECGETLAGVVAQMAGQDTGSDASEASMLS